MPIADENSGAASLSLSSSAAMLPGVLLCLTMRCVLVGTSSAKENHPATGNLFVSDITRRASPI